MQCLPCHALPCLALPCHAVDTHGYGSSAERGVPHAQAHIQRKPLDIRGCHVLGGRLRNLPAPAAPAPLLQPLGLRVFVDHSVVEAFTSTGAANSCGKNGLFH